MTDKILPKKPCANKCCVMKCGKPAHADLWIEENGAWVSFCTPHARFALKPTYAELSRRTPDARLEAERAVIEAAKKWRALTDWESTEARLIFNELDAAVLALAALTPAPARDGRKEEK